MTRKISPELRETLLEELRIREHYSTSRIGQRHGVSRQTLTRLRLEVLHERLSHFDSRVISTHSNTGTDLPSASEPRENPSMLERVVELIARVVQWLENHEGRIARLEAEQMRDREMLNDARRELDALRAERLTARAAAEFGEPTVYN